MCWRLTAIAVVVAIVVVVVIVIVLYGAELGRCSTTCVELKQYTKKNNKKITKSYH